LGFSVSASTINELYNEQLEASGGEALLEAVPEETKELLDLLNITSLDKDSLRSLDAPTVWKVLSKILSAVAPKPLLACGTVLGIIIVFAWVEGLKNMLHHEEVTTVFSVICSLSACGAVMFPIAECVRRVCTAMESVSVFMTAFAPVYAGILLSGGSTVSALSFQSVVLYAAELLTYLSGYVILPLLTVALALGLTGSLTPEMRLGKASEWMGKTASWLLTLGMFLFTGLLSLQSLVGNAVDKLGDRIMKFSIATFVPVVGSSLSEAFTTIRGCLGLLRSTMGGFGIVTSLLIVLPPLLSCFVWQVSLSLCNMAAEMFELPSLSGVLKTAHGVTKNLIGVLAASGMLLILSVTVVTVAMGGI
jgi:stage III sporulation protein AE